MHSIQPLQQTGHATDGHARRDALSRVSRLLSVGVPFWILRYNTLVSVSSTPGGRNAMTGPRPRYSKEEHARRGTILYEQQIRPQVELGNRGRIVAIDVDSGAFEIAADTLTASQRLLSRCPDAQIWCVRIGHPAVHHFGPRVRSVRP